VTTLKAAPGKTIITDGSHELVHTLLEHDLVDELHLLLYRSSWAAERGCFRSAFTRRSC
jgi:dihydrofolate reductase